jgi:hypothetical protein
MNYRKACRGRAFFALLIKAAYQIYRKNGFARHNRVRWERDFLKNTNNNYSIVLIAIAVLYAVALVVCITMVGKKAKQK